MSNVPSAERVPRKPRWYIPTPAKFLLAVLVMQGVLFLSAHYRWFWFNEQKGYTVLIAIAATVVVLLLLAAVVLVSRFFTSKMQFGLSALLLVVPVVAIPVGWLAREMDLARRQRAAVKWIHERRGHTNAHDHATLAERMGKVRESPRLRFLHSQENRLRRLLGTDFFDGVTGLSILKPEALERIDTFRELESFECASPIEIDLARLRGLNRLRKLDLKSTRLAGTRLEPLRELSALQEVGLSDIDIANEDLEPLLHLKQLKQLGLARTAVTDTGLERLKGMTQLEKLDLWGTQVTDAGLEHLKEFTHLKLLELKGTRVTADGVKKLQSALPGCLIME